ncbi:tail fiber [Synechococcus phage ACG-2014f]|uniref:Tail fiber n=1 Tax=Synechococcus phage ACG-2014f TaxID=1493511 RepID=A0A0E3HGU7_9CAUD|nr:tail fiber [Synechococcus phage ACG-2014f]AIX45785.1 tail fiber [Synechococcus phage ACG-2014f]
MAFKINGVVRIDNSGNGFLGIVTATDANITGVLTATEVDAKVSSKAITEQTDGTVDDVTGADELLLLDAETGGLLRVSIDEFVQGSGIGTLVTDFDNLTVTGITTVATLKGIGSNNISVGSTLSFADGTEIIMGDSGDFSIHHDGDHTYLDETGQGNLKLRTNNFRVTNIAETKPAITAQVTSGVELYFDGNKKIETTNTGVLVSGMLTADRLRSGDIAARNVITLGITTIQDHLEVNDSTGSGTEYNLNVKTNGSSTFGVLGNGNILLGNSSGAPFMATNDHHATSKKYVDDAIADAPSGAAAWGTVAANNSGGASSITLLGGMNVASVTAGTSNAKGNFVVTFATPMPDANYSVTASYNNANVNTYGDISVGSKTASSFEVQTFESSNLPDWQGFGFVVFATNAFPPTGGTGTDSWAAVDQTIVNGACNVPASFNVASVTRTGLGLYDVVFTTPMPTDKYSVVGSITRDTFSNFCTSNRSATGFTVKNTYQNRDNGATQYADNPFSFTVNATNATLPETITTDQFTSAFNAPTFKNILINGNLTINQRNVNITSVSAGEYGEDRWKKTLGGMTQIVEDGNYLPSSSYTLSGTGITTTTANSPASGDWDISTTFGDISVTARSIQLEYGNVASAFDLRPVGVELSLCHRYFYRIIRSVNSTPFTIKSNSNSNDIPAVGSIECSYSVVFPAIMRTQPTGSNYSNNGANNYLAIPGYRAITNSFLASDVSFSYASSEAAVILVDTTLGSIGVVQGAAFPLEAAFSYDIDAEL